MNIASHIYKMHQDFTEDEAEDFDMSSAYDVEIEEAMGMDESLITEHSPSELVNQVEREFILLQNVSSLVVTGKSCITTSNQKEKLEIDVPMLNPNDMGEENKIDHLRNGSEEDKNESVFDAGEERFNFVETAQSIEEIRLQSGNANSN